MTNKTNNMEPQQTVMDELEVGDWIEQYFINNPDANDVTITVTRFTPVYESTPKIRNVKIEYMPIVNPDL
jgi:hypothetical protein